MPEKKIQIQVPGQQGLVDAFEVAVNESTDRWTDVKLEDGSIIRVKPVVVGAARVENRYDNEGNPVYTLKINQVMVVSSAPEHLRKGAAQPSKEVH